MEYTHYNTIEVLFPEAGIVILKLNRPKFLNALNMEMRSELADVIPKLAEDHEILAVILTGTGSAFCAGGDINQQGDNQGNKGPFNGRNRVKFVHNWLKTLHEMEKPVIAAVNGVAAGGGMNIALAADVIFASESAKFSQSFLKIGLVPDCGGMYLLPRIVGLPRAKDIIYSGRTITVDEAMQLGIVQRIYKTEDLLQKSSEYARDLVNGASLAIGVAKNILNHTFDQDFDTVLQLEAYAQSLLMQTHDHIEGVQAFKDKRKPHFKGE